MYARTTTPTDRSLRGLGAPEQRLNLIFFAYSGSSGSGLEERSETFFKSAFTLKQHLEKRFPDDLTRVDCAWHKQTVLNVMLVTRPTLIRQVHYIGHGFPGGLSFANNNDIAHREQARLGARVAKLPTAAQQRALILRKDAGLFSGFFDHGLAASTLQRLRDRLAPDALVQLWGCHTGATEHTFEDHPYWGQLNEPGGKPVAGIARHIAASLGVDVTASRDPKGIHGTGPHRRGHATWMWPRGRSTWVTWDAAGTLDTRRINFLGKRTPIAELPSGQPPPWLVHEIPSPAARPPALPACRCIKSLLQASFSPPVSAEVRFLQDRIAAGESDETVLTRAVFDRRYRGKSPPKPGSKARQQQLRGIRRRLVRPALALSRCP